MKPTNLPGIPPLFSEQPKTPLEIKLSLRCEALSRYIVHLKVGFEHLQKDMQQIEGRPMVSLDTPVTQMKGKTK